MFTGCWMPHVGRDRYAGRGKIPIKPQSEVIRSIVLEDSPYWGGCPHPIATLPETTAQTPQTVVCST